MKKRLIVTILFIFLLGSLQFPIFSTQAQDTYETFILVVDDFELFSIDRGLENIPDNGLCYAHPGSLGQGFASSRGMSGVGWADIQLPHGEMIVQQLLREYDPDHIIPIPITNYGDTSIANQIGTALSMFISNNPNARFVVNMSFALLPCELYRTWDICVGGERDNYDTLDACLENVMAESGIDFSSYPDYQTSLENYGIADCRITGECNAIAAILEEYPEYSVAVAAAGNFGFDYPFIPAAWDNVVSVSANDTQGMVPSNNGDRITSGRWELAPNDVAGTSFAAPRVSIMLAQYLDSGFPTRCPNGWTPLETRVWNNEPVTGDFNDYCETVTPQSANTISYGQSVNGTLNRSQGRWTFSGSAGDVVTIAMNSSDFDTYLELLGPNGQQVAFNDDGGQGLNSLINSFTLPADGRYTIVARSYGNNGSGSYSLSLSVSSPPSGGGNRGGNSIGYGQSITGTLNRSQDRWTFSGSAGDVVTIAMTSSNFDTYLELLGPNGQRVTSNDDGGEGLNSLIEGFTLPASGTYTIIARSFADSGSGRYSLSLATGGTGRGGGSSGTGGNSIAYGQSVTGTLNRSQDRWTFSGSAGDVVTIAMTSSDFDTYLELLGPNGQQVAFNDDGGQGLNSLISGFQLPVGGTYTIIARSFADSGRGSYSLSLSR